MTIQDILQTGGGIKEIQGKPVEGKPRVTSKKAEKGKPEVSKTDRVDISPEAKELQQTESLIAAAKKAFEELPDVREEVIKEVAERLERGTYDRSDVVEKLAEALLRVGIFSPYVS